jgi:hypothetical protein
MVTVSEVYGRASPVTGKAQGYVKCRCDCGSPVAVPPRTSAAWRLAHWPAAPALARASAGLPGPGTAATLTANVAHRLGRGLTGTAPGG